MKWQRFIPQPRLLAGLALALALVPAGLALLMYRDASRKDELVFQTTAQVLAEQLQALFEQHTYYPIECRNAARKLDDAALTEGKMMRQFDWRKRLPHILALGYAQQAGESIVVRWKDEAEAGVVQNGEDLTTLSGVSAALREGGPPQSSVTRGCLLEHHRMLVLLAVPAADASKPPRGHVFAWLDLDAMCRSRLLPLARDENLLASFLEEGAEVPPRARRASIHDGSAKWSVAISRGGKFSEGFGAVAPWMILIAVGLSAGPLLVLASLAGRAARLRAELAAEREIGRQQRFFAQSVSHEFRTPLGIIMSGADLLDGYLEHLSPARRREVLGEIKGSTRQMNEMVEQVLMLGRIESGKLPLNPQPVNLSSLCNDAARLATAAAHDSRGIEVAAPDSDARLDASLVASILDNLLSNALKYSPPGSPVKLNASSEGRQVIFAVSDQGIGIPKEDVARVCDPFHRCANIGGRPGSGLGLAIMQRCVALHSGSLHIASEEGRGTTITVTLPVA